MEKLVRKIGSEKIKDFNENFDMMIDKYRQISMGYGYEGKLTFKKEHGLMIIFVEL